MFVPSMVMLNLPFWSGNDRHDTWVTVCTGHIGDTSSPRGGSDALEGVFGDGRKAAVKKGCAEPFQANLMWVQLQVAPQGVPGILVQNNNTGFCGVAGCALKLFIIQTNGEFD